MKPSKKSENICFDARFASGPICSGQSTYLHNLLRVLSEIDRKHQYHLLSNHFNSDGISGLRENFHYHKITNVPHRLRRILPFQNIWWRGLVPAWTLLGHKPDIVCSAINVGPLPLNQGKYVAVAHDLDYLEFPELYSQSNRLKNERNTVRSIARADHIIAISEATKKQITKYYDYPSENITVIHHGYDRTLYNGQYTNEQRLAVKEKYKLPEQFIFSLGSLSPKKNINTLFQAISELKLQRNISVACILAGGFSHKTRIELENQIKALNICENVQFIGYIPTSELPLVYRSASAFVFPSIAEGFGLPLVEAMACACPVVTSNTSCMPEIVGDAALTCDPMSTLQLGDALDRLLNDRELSKTLRQKGLDKAQFYSWDKSARATLAVFNSLLD